MWRRGNRLGKPYHDISECDLDLEPTRICFTLRYQYEDVAPSETC
jgi:hypothetical protein